MYRGLVKDNVGINLDSLFLEREVPSYFHPNKSAFIKLGKFKKLAIFGELNPIISNKYGLKNNPIIFSIFLEKVNENKISQKMLNSLNHRIHLSFAILHLLLIKKLKLMKLLKLLKISIEN